MNMGFIELNVHMSGQEAQANNKKKEQNCRALLKAVRTVKKISETVSQRLDDSSRRLALFQEGKTREEVLQLMGPRDTSVSIEALREQIKLEIDYMNV